MNFVHVDVDNRACKNFTIERQSWNLMPIL